MKRAWKKVFHLAVQPQQLNMSFDRMTGQNESNVAADLSKSNKKKKKKIGCS